MLIKDNSNAFIFTTSAFWLYETNLGLKVVSSNNREHSAYIALSKVKAKEAMDHIYKCYKRGDRCCDLNDLLKKDNEK